jgi:hypothetical protein
MKGRMKKATKLRNIGNKDVRKKRRKNVRKL